MIRLTHRQRWWGIGLVTLVGVWALFVLGISPAIERIETLSRVIPEKQSQLGELQTKSAQYLTLQAGLDNLKRKAASQEKGFELPAFLESIAGQLHLAKKIATMKQELLQLDSAYSRIIVEVKLEDITLKQLVDFLLKIKSSDHFLRIQSLYTKRNATNLDLLDTAVEVSVIKQNDGV